MTRFSPCARAAFVVVLLSMGASAAPRAAWAQFDDPFGEPFDPFRAVETPPAEAPAVPAKPHGDVTLAEPSAARRFGGSEKEILAALDKPVTLEFVETPLMDAADYIADLMKINVQIDKRALDDVGIGPDATITLSVRKISLRGALRLMLRQLVLEFIVCDDALLITTPESAENKLVTRVYPVGRLLRSGDPLVDDVRQNGDWLMDAITSTVRQTTWEDVGGPGSAALLHNKLVVRQSTPVHDELAALLSALEDSQKIISAAGKGPPKAAFLPRPQGAHAKIEKALADERGDCDFIETPLKDVAAFFAEAGKINILLDHRALEDVGIGDDTPVTRRVKGVSLGAALRLMLREMDCTYVIRDEVLLITTPEECESQLMTRVYPVHDLVHPDEDDFLSSASYGLAGAADYDSLIDLITSIVRPTMWEVVGGPGPIEAYHGCLVISQTKEVFDEIDALLAGLRKMKAQYAADDGRIVAEPLVLDELHSPAHAKLREALRRDVGMVAFNRTPLADVVDTLADRHGVPIQIDYRAFEDVGIGADTGVTVTLGGETFGAALRRILSELKLTWAIRDEVILITTPEECEGAPLTRIYPVRDLVLPADITSLEADIGRRADDWELIDTLTGTVRPTTWEDVGGSGAIEFYHPCLALVVSQTEEVHEEIAQLLAKIRAADEAPDKPADDDADEPPADERAKLQADEGNVLKERGGERLHLKVYSLASRERDAAGELAEVIRELVEPGSWKADELYYLKPVAGSIIIRHTAATHRKIHRLLYELGALWCLNEGLSGGADPGGDGEGSRCFGGPLGGMFSVPDDVRAYIGAACGTGMMMLHRQRRGPFTTIVPLSLAAEGDRPAMPLAVYHLRHVTNDDARDIAEAVGELAAADDGKTAAGVYLRAVGRKLLVRNRTDVHRRVYRLLAELGAVDPPSRASRSQLPYRIPVVGRREGFPVQQ